MSRQIRNSPRTDWGTPLDFFTAIHMAMAFKVDAAANEQNALLPEWYGPGSPAGLTDALAVETWASPAWCNPPYFSGESWIKWLEKFKEQADKGVTIMTLLPAAVGTQWFRRYVVPNCDLLFITGRLNFTRPTRSRRKSQGNHDSVLALWGPQATGQIAWINAKPGGGISVGPTEPVSGVSVGLPSDGIHEPLLGDPGPVPGDPAGGGAWGG